MLDSAGDRKILDRDHAEAAPAYTKESGEAVYQGFTPANTNGQEPDLHRIETAFWAVVSFYFLSLISTSYLFAIYMCS